VRRVRQKRSIYSPDKEHIHHRLLALGMRDTSILLIVYGACIVFGAAAVGTVFLDRLAGLVLLACMWALAVGAIGVLDGARRRRADTARGLVGKP
jgi:UDP-GlcNAc:undecaprenyl-phosphate GlcNAc-1-phosphate transferase